MANQANHQIQSVFFDLEELLPGSMTDIQELCKYLGLNQKELAKLIKVDPAQISRKEVSNNNLNVKKVRRLLFTLAFAARNRGEQDDKIKNKVLSFFRTPIPKFEFKTPTELLKAGRLRALQDYAEEALGVTLP